MSVDSVRCSTSAFYQAFNMGVYGVMFRLSTPFQLRIQALINPICAFYMTCMTLSVTHISFFYIVPECYYGDPDSILKHRIAIWYMFTSVVGHFVTCVFTDTSVKRTPQNDVTKHKDAENTCDQVPQMASNNNGTDEQDILESPTEPRPPRGMKHCDICNMYTPFRSHHCFLCERCILKRDHHCFFMGVCIGRHNHIYFIFFTLAMGMGTFYGMMLIVKYMHYLYGLTFYGPQTFLTLFFNTFSSLLEGNMPSIRYLALFVLLYISLAGTMVGFGFFCWQMMIICCGQTSYEAARNINKYSKDSYLANFRAVFNLRSLVSLLLPFWDILTDTNYCRIAKEHRTRSAKSNGDVRPRRKVKQKEH